MVLKIRIIVIIHEKADPVISNSRCQQEHHKYIDINLFTGKDTHTHTHIHEFRFDVITCEIQFGEN